MGNGNYVDIAYTNNSFPDCDVANQESQINYLTHSNKKLNIDFSNIDMTKEIGVRGCHQRVPGMSFRESFINILTHLLEILHLYRNEVNDTFIPYFHVIPESQNSANKIWVAVTGLDSYVKIEQIANNSFRETQVSPGVKDESGDTIPCNKVREFSGSSAKEFMRLLSEHDVHEINEPDSNLKVVANALKLDVADTNCRKGYNHFHLSNEDKMMEILRDKKPSLSDNYLYQQDTKKLKVPDEDFSALFHDAERRFNSEASDNSNFSCCGEKINSTISELLNKKIQTLNSGSNANSLTYNGYEELFKRAVFTFDECERVRGSLKDEDINEQKIEEIISCLSSPTGIGNFFYACSQAFEIANNLAVSVVQNSIVTMRDKLYGNNDMGFTALNGRNNQLHVDFSEYEFTQIFSVLRAVVYDNDTFDIANYIYTTNGESYISIIPGKDDTYNYAGNYAPSVYSAESYRFTDNSLFPEKDSINRNFSGNITIVAYT
ncbi:hypothetical protein [Escherichia coli]|uniref:hypothetical protein n=1 Tax=Escherichia coli TaxID=562 RepID=UPI0038B3155B